MAKKILIVAPIPCYPAYSGNSARIAAVHELLVERGFDVYYLHLPEAPFDPQEMKSVFKEKYFYRDFRTFTSSKIKLVIKGINTILLKKNSRKVKIDDFLASIDIPFYKRTIKAVQPDIVWLNYVYYTKLFDHTPAGITKILDTHDSVYLRFNTIFNNITGYKNLKITVADEIKCIDRADHIVCIQKAEEDFFRENGATKPLIMMGHIHPFAPTSIRGQKNKLLFLANDNFMYKDAILTFITDVLPGLKAQKPDIHLYIAGRVCDRLKKDLANDNITLLGIVPDLPELYDKIDVTINPVALGSGLKIKNIESLCFGKPVITTPSGKEGLEVFEDKGILIANDNAEWISKILDLLDNEAHYDHQVSDLRNSIATYNAGNIAAFEDLVGIDPF